MRKGQSHFCRYHTGTLPNIPTLANNAIRSVLVDNQYDWKDYKDTHLNAMGNNGWLDDNENDIINYIQRTPSIKHIYFTFNSGNWLLARKNAITLAIPHANSCSIFTPTGNGFGHNLPVPFQERGWSIAHHWVWNTLPHPVLVNNPAFGHLDHDWLIRNGVTPANF